MMSHPTADLTSNSQSQIPSLTGMTQIPGEIVRKSLMENSSLIVLHIKILAGLSENRTPLYGDTNELNRPF